MSANRQYTLAELLDRLGLDYDASRGKMDCFGCGKRKKINLDFKSNFWRCPACGTSGGVLHLFSRLQLGYEIDEGTPKEKKQEVSELLQSFMEGSPCDPVKVPEKKPQKPSEVEQPVASDDDLHKAYSVMMRMPALQLLPEHRNELLRRGLSEEAIERNGYRSIPEQCVIHNCYTDRYNTEGGEKRRQKTLNWLSAYQIKLGLMIANYVLSAGCSLQGIPGFFKFGESWCFWCVPGILIPTRNIAGQIVVWQVRRDKLTRKSDNKYITVAAKALPGHVTGSVSRCHFPLSNEPLTKNSMVLVTEGPLKADVAGHLYGSPVVFAAIPGIQTTTDLLSYAKLLKKTGVRSILNALDMDRLTNPNVRKGSVKLAKALQKRGLLFQDMFWDERYAVTKLLSLQLIAKLRNVPVVTDANSNVYHNLDIVSDALSTAGIKPWDMTDANGESVHYYWDPKTKGIDDYLLNR